jgi:nucleotide-binding universal stress UspA family protein
VSVEGNPAEEIIKYAESAQVDLVIMGSSGFSGMRNMLGSVARKVTMNINRPILIIK